MAYNNGIGIRSIINGDYSYDNCASYVLHPLNKWLKVEVSQIKKGKDYIWSASVDGREICTVNNAEPQEFYNIEVKLSHSRYPQTGFVRNLLMMVEE